MTKNYIHAGEAAQYLGISKDTLYKKCQKREIPFYAMSKRNYLFLPSELDAFIASLRVAPIDDMADDMLQRLGK